MKRMFWILFTIALAFGIAYVNYLNPNSPLIGFGYMALSLLLAYDIFGNFPKRKRKRKLLKYLFRYSDGSTEEITIEQDSPMTISSNTNKQLIQLQVYNFEKEDE